MAQSLHVLAYETKPFSYREPDGTPAGLEIDILKYFARGSGRSLEIEWADDWDLLVERMVAGDADIVAGTMTITPKREEVLDFSASYFPVRVMLVTRKGDAVSSLDELAGSRLATVPGTTYEEVLSRVPDATFVYGTMEDELFEAIRSGAARAAAADSGIALRLLGQFPELELGMALTEEQHWGFAMPKGSALKPELDETLTKLRGSGIYHRLLNKYLGAAAATLVKSGRQ
jgi:ABC-type amino acid transport substrate-binding protein